MIPENEVNKVDEVNWFSLFSFSGCFSTSATVFVFKWLLVLWYWSVCHPRMTFEILLEYQTGCWRNHDFQSCRWTFRLDQA